MLSDAKCRNASTQAKILKLADSNGLYLWVYPAGRKYWRLRYWQLGKEKSLSLGVYPDISLKEARDRRDVERKKLNSGLDPSQERKAKKIRDKLSAENSFEAIGREWHGKRSHKWTAKYSAMLLRRLEVDVFPKLGSRPIGEINAPEVLAMLRVIEARGAHDLSHRVQQVCGQIFTYAIVTGRAERNPVNDLRGALTPIVRKHNAYLKAEELPEFLQKLEDYDGAQTKLAMKFLLLTFVRTGEMRGAKWSEIDMDKAEWRIPAERMKMREQHKDNSGEDLIRTILREPEFKGQRSKAGKRLRPSSSVYKTDELSVYAESLMIEQKRAPEECLKDYPDTYLSAVKAGSIRKYKDCPIVKDNEPPEDPAHCLVHGKKTGSFGKAMVREHEWVVAPSTQE